MIPLQIHSFSLLQGWYVAVAGCYSMISEMRRQDEQVIKHRFSFRLTHCYPAVTHRHNEPPVWCCINTKLAYVLHLTLCSLNVNHTFLSLCLSMLTNTVNTIISDIFRYCNPR